MKKGYLILLILIQSCVAGSLINLKNSNEIPVRNVDNKLFVDNMVIWGVKEFNNVKKAIQYKNSTSGHIIFKYRVSFSVLSSPCFLNIILDIRKKGKDKVVVVFEEPKHINCGYISQSSEQEINFKINGLRRSLAAFINNI